MSAVKLFFLEDEHPYASADVPWEMDSEGPSLPRYLRAGGVKGLGGTCEEMVRARRQTRFLVFFALLAVVWCALLFV